MTTTWRLKATEGYGWVERIDLDGRCAVTADPMGAHQWGARAQVDSARARLRPGVVPFEVVEGPAFDRRTHGQPG